jgi:ligand-binding sensor domain-containing protein
MLSRPAILLLVMLSVANLLPAQSYYFKNFQGNKGIATNNITCITQDKKGFMWFGGRKGCTVLMDILHAFSGTVILIHPVLAVTPF